MRLLVCGGREFNDRMAVYDYLNRLKPAAVIQGEARGADFLAKMWALATETPLEGYHADWVRYGKAAGAIRNQQMLDEGKPDAVLAFPGGRGTADMVRRARKACVTVIHAIVDTHRMAETENTGSMRSMSGDGAGTAIAQPPEQP